MEGTFSIAHEIGSDYSVVSVVGELDVATAPDLRSHFEEAVDRGGLVIADLLESLKRAESAGADLRIVVAEPRIFKIFEITGLTDVFSIFPTLDAAIA